MEKLAMYFRLSLEDMNKRLELENESQSIGNQRKLVRAFIAQDQTLSQMQAVEFLDDGYTGTNFERPQFIAMMDAAKRGEIKCIIVKDLSRFGRNYLDVGDYLEHIFPFLGIRFVAVNDNYDSNNYIGKTGGMDVAFRNFIYDSYSKDLSVKVRSAMHTRMLKGRFVNHTPYGYMKSPTDKHQMIPDPVSAPIVREIFMMAIDGKTTSEIARELNARSIPTPMEYKNHKLRPDCENREVMWSHVKVINILRNYKYTGAMTNHTRESRHMRDRNQRRVKPEDWIITEAAHEAIVSHEEFEQAAKCIRQVSYTPHKVGDISDRVFFCGHCGRKLRKTFGTDTYFSCDTPMYQENASCKDLRWSKRALEDVLLPIYKAQLLLLGKRINTVTDAVSHPKTMDLTKKLTRIEQSISACDAEKISLYERYREGALTRDGFVQKKAELDVKQSGLRKEHEEVELSMHEEEAKQTQFDVQMQEAERFLSGLTAAPEQVRQEMYAAIERVTIFDHTHLTIQWKFDDLFAHINHDGTEQITQQAV